MEQAPDDRKRKQIELAEKLQDLLLEDFIRLANDKALTSTDRAILYRMLRDSGWDLDPAKLSQSARDLLTKAVAFDEDLDGEPRLKVI